MERDPARSTQWDVRRWWRAAFEASVVRRALLFAAVVGAVLIGINHGDALLAGDVDGVRVFKMLLTVCVPYTVSTLSSVAAQRDRDQASESGSSSSR